MLTRLGILADKEPEATAYFRNDISHEDLETINAALPHTMTSPERLISLIDAVRYVVERSIPGAIVECGVWKGGSMVAVAKTLLQLGHTRPLYLFDTFEGMTEPTECDVDLDGKSASALLSTEDKLTSPVWAYGHLSEVQNNLRQTGYAENSTVYVKGPVETTIPLQAPTEIAILRLDTDWYESTYHELLHLYPRLSVGGVLIIDDYGHWEGARKAVDQYVSENGLKLFLNRVDYTGRLSIKLHQ